MKYLVFIIFLFFISCKSEKRSEIRNVTETLFVDSSATVKLEGEKMDLDLLCPMGVLCMDTVLLFFQDFEEIKISAYGMQSEQLLGRFLRKGGGPNEVYLFSGFTQSFFQSGAPKIVVQSYPQYLAILDLNETLDKNKTVYEKKYSFTDEQRNSVFISSNTAFYIEENIFLLTKAPERSGKTENNNTYFELYDYDKNKIIKSFYATDLPFIPQAFQLYKGVLALKNDRKKIASFMRFIPMLAITDIETGSSKQIFPFGKEEELESYIEKPGHYYWSVCSTDNRIVALYKGGIDPRELEDVSVSYLHIYDWEGRLLYKMEIEDNIKCISLSEEAGMIYAVLMNDEIKRYCVKQYL